MFLNEVSTSVTAWANSISLGFNASVSVACCLPADVLPICFLRPSSIFFKASGLAPIFLATANIRVGSFFASILRIWYLMNLAMGLLDGAGTSISLLSIFPIIPPWALPSCFLSFLDAAIIMAIMPLGIFFFSSIS